MAAMAARAAAITPSASLRIPRFREWAEEIGTRALAENRAIQIEHGVEVDGSRLELVGLDVGLRADAELS